MNGTPTDRRAEYIKGLRMFADLLESNPDTIPLPYNGGAGEFASARITMWFHGADARRQLGAAARAFPGRLNKSPRGDEYFEMVGALHGLHLDFVAMRHDVCERIVVGEREVTRTVPDPTVKVPTVEVTETVQDVEWKCPPSLLAEARS